MNAGVIHYAYRKSLRKKFKALSWTKHPVEKLRIQLQLKGIEQIIKEREA